MTAWSVTSRQVNPELLLASKAAIPYRPLIFEIVIIVQVLGKYMIIGHLDP